VYEAWRLLTLSETHDPGGGQIEWIINVQGDEPLLEPAHVDRLAELMKAERSRRMGTLRCVSQDAIKS
jgi:CMP-2-keto-3-deoxyoctulosonic acid synthetase